jgi:hypothetical protein
VTNPIMPTVTAEEYAIDRYQLTVHTSLGRRVALNGQHFTLKAQDWPTPELAEQAASAASHIFARNEAYRYFPIDKMADHIAADLNQDISRPYGMSLILEPV